MTPQLITEYFVSNKAKTLFVPFSPGLVATSDLPLVQQSKIQIPRNALFAICVQAVTNEFAKIAADGTASNCNFSLADFTGIPILVVQTTQQIQSNSGGFIFACNGYMAIPWTTNSGSLTAGRFAVGGIIPSTALQSLPTDGATDYKLQIYLQDSGGNVLRIPNRPIYVDILADAGAGITTGANAPAIAYGAKVIIPSGQSSITIPITDLTAATGVLASLTQQDNGNGLTTLWGTIADGSLTIHSGDLAPNSGWVAWYQLGHL
jgi:hypothetical protein